MFVTGGNTKFPNFQERLERELLAIRPFQSTFKVYEAGKPTFRYVLIIVSTLPPIWVFIVSWLDVSYVIKTGVTTWSKSIRRVKPDWKLDSTDRHDGIILDLFLLLNKIAFVGSKRKYSQILPERLSDVTAACHNFFARLWTKRHPLICEERTRPTFPDGAGQASSVNHLL